MPNSPFETASASEQTTAPVIDRRRHKRKRKHSHRNRIPRQAIIGILLLLACLSAFGVWYFLVQDGPRRTAAPVPGPQTCIKA